MVRRLLPLLTLAALVAPPSAAAAAAPAPAGTLQPLTPFAGARATAGTRLTFRARVPAEALTPVRIVVASSPRTDGGALRPDAVAATGDAAPGALDPFVVEWRPSGAAARALARRGRYWWQVVARSSAPAGAEERSTPRSLVLTAPALAGGPIPRWIGRHGHTAFRVSLRNVPSEVSVTRFLALAVGSGRRWGLRPLGTTNRVAGRRDGVSVVGFSRALPPGALGLTTIYRVVLYRVTRRCGPAGCVMVGPPRRVGTRVVVRDVALDPTVSWAPGPAHPAIDRYDLETALLHELGHAAGNRRHARRCADSPMVPALAAGEWWRGPDDFRFRRCGEAGAARKASLATRDVVVGRAEAPAPAPPR